MTQRERQVEQLFKLHYRAMYRLASILLHDDDESKDIVHDVFARLLVCLNALRNRNIHEQVHRYLLPVDEVEQTSPEDFERLVDMLKVGVNELFPPICQEVIRLHFTESLTFSEIAKRMGVSETTIYKHLRNALDQLRQTLKKAEQ